MISRFVRRQVPIISACILTLLAAQAAWCGKPARTDLIDKPLLLSLNPPSASSGPDCGHDGPPRKQKPEHPGHPGGGRPGAAVESEHRPVPKRAYHLNAVRRLAQVEALVRQPDGSIIEPELHLGVDPGLSFPTPMGNGPVHGANNVYVVEKGVENNTLLIRTAKWITMHHSCGWGHDGKFDEMLTKPQGLDSIPLEIVMNKLWDTNFHSSVTSGDNMVITVLSYGVPVPGARVTLSTDKGWSKEVTTDEAGKAKLQLIRDYYPDSWPEFHRTYRGKFLVTARYDALQDGEYRNTHYDRISYITTLPWKYSPSAQDYSSYAYGLLVGSLSLTVSGVGVYAYRERRKKPYKRITFRE